jgi:hypothetical protein
MVVWWYWTAASLRFSQRRAGERIGGTVASLLAEARAREDE